MTKKTHCNLNASIQQDTMERLEEYMTWENRTKSNAVDTLLRVALNAATKTTTTKK